MVNNIFFIKGNTIKICIICTFILLATLNISFAKDPKPDPVLKKYQGRIDRIKKEYKKSADLIRNQLIADYKKYQKLVMKNGDLEAANNVQLKIKALEDGKKGIENKDGEMGNEFDFDISINDGETKKESKEKTSNKIKRQYKTNIAPKAKITASSFYSGNKPKNITDGIIKKKYMGVWRTNKEVKGAWIEFIWDKPNYISHLKIVTNDNANNYILKAEIIINKNDEIIKLDEFSKSSLEMKVDVNTNKKVNSLKIKILEGVCKIGVSFREIEIYGSSN